MIDKKIYDLGDQYKRLAYIRKRNLEAYGYLVEATRMLEGV